MTARHYQRFAVVAFTIALLAGCPGSAHAVAPQLKLKTDRVAAGAPMTLKVFVVSRRVPLGAYTFEITFDATLLEVTAVNGGTVREFASPPLANPQQFQSGTVRFSTFQAQRLDGPTGRMLVAELTLQPHPLPFNTTRARVRVELRSITLTDTSGHTYNPKKRAKRVTLRAP